MPAGSRPASHPAPTKDKQHVSSPQAPPSTQAPVISALPLCFVRPIPRPAVAPVSRATAPCVVPRPLPPGQALETSFDTPTASLSPNPGTASSQALPAPSVLPIDPKPRPIATRTMSIEPPTPSPITRPGTPATPDAGRFVLIAPVQTLASPLQKSQQSQQAQASSPGIAGKSKNPRNPASRSNNHVNSPRKPDNPPSRSRSGSGTSRGATPGSSSSQAGSDGGTPDDDSIASRVLSRSSHKSVLSSPRSTGKTPTMTTPKRAWSRRKSPSASRTSSSSSSAATSSWRQLKKRSQAPVPAPAPPKRDVSPTPKRGGARPNTASGKKSPAPESGGATKTVPRKHRSGKRGPPSAAPEPVLAGPDPGPGPTGKTKPTPGVNAAPFKPKEIILDLEALFGGQVKPVSTLPPGPPHIGCYCPLFPEPEGAARGDDELLLSKPCGAPAPAPAVLQSQTQPAPAAAAVSTPPFDSLACFVKHVYPTPARDGHFFYVENLHQWDAMTRMKQKLQAFYDFFRDVMVSKEWQNNEIAGLIAASVNKDKKQLRRKGWVSPWGLACWYQAQDVFDETLRYADWSQFKRVFPRSFVRSAEALAKYSAGPSNVPALPQIQHRFLDSETGDMVVQELGGSAAVNVAFVENFDQPCQPPGQQHQVPVLLWFC